MPTVITRGGMSAQGFGFGAVASKLYVEDVFSTWLYTGNGSTQTITNGIDLAGKGGMVWVKSRSAATNHFLFDTTRGVNVEINSNTTDANATLANSVTAFNSTGFALGSAADANTNAATYASWTFREAPKFFDVVTYTGTGANRTIAHSLGVIPGCIIVKRTDTTADWQVYHRSNANTEYMALNSTAAKATGATRWNSTTPTATEFTVGTDTTVNASGATYVAYLFAHDATADGVIQCGSFTTDGSGNATVNLGWEPQFAIWKGADVATNWIMNDNMRGWPVNTNSNVLLANSANAEITTGSFINSSTGFRVENENASKTYIYIAIRRGPMKTPTLGTSVFAPVVATPTGSDPYITTMTTNFPVDLTMSMNRDYGTSQSSDRLRGGTKFLVTNNANAEQDFTSATWPGYTSFDSNTAITQRVWSAGYGSIIGWNFRRAPGFFDVVCYTGNGVNGRTINHNLGVTPELMIMKNRSSAGYSWFTWDKSADLSQANALLALNVANGRPAFSSGNLNSTVPTSTVFTIGGDSNASGGTYVAYLFASCPGVSKVGSYTGNGSSQTINCGFSNGARFFLVKRTNASGDWWVWDSARGITAPADPALRLNSTAAEVTSADATDPDSTGIIVNQESTCNINVNGATYIFLAVA